MESMSVSEYANQYRKAGYAVFGLHGVKNGVCGCGNPECKALYKHPIASGWQNTPVFSDEQFELGIEFGQFDTGFGVLCKGLLVIDVDARNGGVKSFRRLVQRIPELAACQFVVNTGSGNGSRHYYFKAPAGVSLSQHLKHFKGIDFKSSGYVVGAGSMHASGNRYTVLKGRVENITAAPQKLIDLLAIKEKHRTEYNGALVDISDSQIAEMLDAIDPDCEYDKWIRCGMAIHEATNGSGFLIWDTWSSKGKKYKGPHDLYAHWSSFGQSANPVTIGTLIHYAIEAGYQFEEDVQFGCSFEDEPITQIDKTVDLLRPPGFVGRIAKWINSQSRYPREHLAVAAALMTVSSVAGMRYRDDTDGTVANMFCFGVAGSATGKESILDAYFRLLREAGVAPAVHGSFKSEKELYQNLIRHQAAIYAIDEMGEVLGKVVNARKKSTVAYLEGLIGTLMSIYSKGNSYAPIGGDMKEDIRKAILHKMAGLEKGSDKYTQLEETLDNIEEGLKNPFLNIFGLTTPERFTALMDFDMATSGFIGRSLIFKEANDNPYRNKNRQENEEEFKKISARLKHLYLCGHSETPTGRVERVGPIEIIPTTQKGVELLDEVEEYFMSLAEFHKEKTGLTALPRRGRELVSKVSLTLAIPEGVRTEEHIRWAFALVKRDIEGKINITNANSSIDKAERLMSRILSLVDADEGVTLGILKNKCRPEKPENIERAVEILLKNKKIKEVELFYSRGRKTKKYFLA